SLLPPTIWPHVARPVRKVHTFGKRANSIKRDPNSPVIMRGWLYKQDSSGLKLWKRRWFVLSNYCLFYYRGNLDFLQFLFLRNFTVSITQFLETVMLPETGEFQPFEVEPRQAHTEVSFCGVLRGVFQTAVKRWFWAVSSSPAMRFGQLSPRRRRTVALYSRSGGRTPFMLLSLL
uniref:PH domain-containing protein n=1 Tax=Laticauda laticaudata TaxID=8630 RepID=A0A8C5SKH7_LATLA